MARKKKPDKKKLRRLARILVGPVPSSKAIKAKVQREKPKHKKPIDPEDHIVFSDSDKSVGRVP